MPILGFTLRGVDCDPPRERALEVSVVATNGRWEHEGCGLPNSPSLMFRCSQADPAMSNVRLRNTSNWGEHWDTFRIFHDFFISILRNWSKHDKKHDHHKYSKMFFSPQFPWRDPRLHRSWIDYPIVPWRNMAWWQHVATVLGFTSNSHGKMGAFPPAILAHLWASPPAKQTEAVFQADSQIAADLHRLCTNSKLSKFSSS